MGTLLSLLLCPDLICPNAQPPERLPCSMQSLNIQEEQAVNNCMHTRKKTKTKTSKTPSSQFQGSFKLPFIE